MYKRFDTGKQPYDATKDTQATAPSHKPQDFIRLSSESTPEHPRLLAVTKEDAQATDGYSKGSLYELQREQQQRELHLKATGGWHPQDLSHPIPEQRLLGGVLTDSHRHPLEFLTPEERTAKNQYSNGLKNKMTNLGNSLYKRVYRKIHTDKISYTEVDIIDDLNKTRQGTEYKNVFGYNTLYDPNDSGSTETHEEVGESSTQDTPKEQDTTKKEDDYDTWFHKHYPR
jgi:hypothetical protein